jgi:predicted DCC family thiol-disulfide oxidoreductase YuxK
VLVVPAQAPGVRDRHGLTHDDTDRAAWAIEPDGRKHRGAAAINRALAELPGAWPRVAALYPLPVARQVEDGVYAVVARTRGWLSHLTRTPPEVPD